MGSESKKEYMRIAGDEPIFYMDEEVTFAQADAWFGHVSRDIRMNIIYPQTDKRKYPCIVWICGGGWSQVNKGAHMPYLADLARRGFVVASVDYRLAHEAGFPGALVDIKAAIRYLRAHADRYSIDSEKFGAMGESAGGYLTAMIGVTCGAEFEKGDYLDYSSGVQAACPWYMPCDIAGFVKGIEYRLPFFDGNINGDENYRRFINPACYITPQSPPFLILHGDADETVPLSEGEMFYEALTAQGVYARMIVLEGEGHAGPQFFQRPLWEIIVEFFKEKLG